MKYYLNVLHYLQKDIDIKSNNKNISFIFKDYNIDNRCEIIDKFGNLMK